MSSIAKKPIQYLLLPPTYQLLTHNLTADPFTPDANAFHEDVQKTKPSLQRRARLLDEKAHFSFVAPLPYPFPYRIEVEEQEDRTKAVEGWLSAKEALKEVDLGEGTTLKAYSSDERIQDYHLLGIARRGVEECLPSLDVGDALEYIGEGKLTARNAVKKTDKEVIEETNAEVDIIMEKPSQHTNGNAPTPGPAKTRQILTDILSGNTVLMDPSKEHGYAPWSLRYSGHQFGNWAGQLGDGRAISIRKYS